MTRKKLTVYDYLQSKGKRQLSALFVHNVEEAEAAEESGVDMICTANDIPQHGINTCLLYTSPSPRDLSTSRMPSSA